MKKVRKIKKRVIGNKTIDGAGVHLVRVLGYDDVFDFDPFLLLDVFDSTDPKEYTKGFPWHPHRGIETITCLIEGKIEHEDSLGNRGFIEAGDMQWMTSGSGIIHQEMPLKSDRMRGFQLWLNLPSEKKMAYPRYHEIQRKDVPLIHEEGVSIKVLAGKYKSIEGVFRGEYVDATILDVTLEKKQTWNCELTNQCTAMAYIVKGHGFFEEDLSESVHEKTGILFEEGHRIEVKTEEVDLRFFLFFGQPLHEEIAWGGPIVMNTKEELEQAFEELKNETFL
jgi:redox-sensitive bicupin YhaK (pirin superfamily)